MTAETLADVAPSAASYVFSPSFLWSVAADAHRPLLRDLGVPRVLGNRATVGQMYDRLYDEMIRTYRSEYLYKNEVIRRVFEARHNPDRSTVLLEKPIAHWASRVDLIVVNDTTTAYEIKTDYDDLGRVRRQTDFTLQIFDRVQVVCSERLVHSVIAQVDDRVGILAMRAGGAFHRVRSAMENASMIDPAAVFSVLRRDEYVPEMERRFGSLVGLDPIARYSRCADIFARLAPLEAHRILLNALRRRFVRCGDKEALRGLPHCLAHLFYKATAKERRQLFSSAVLGRTVG